MVAGLAVPSRLLLLAAFVLTGLGMAFPMVGVNVTDTEDGYGARLGLTAWGMQARSDAVDDGGDDFISGYDGILVTAPWTAEAITTAANEVERETGRDLMDGVTASRVGFIFTAVAACLLAVAVLVAASPLTPGRAQVLSIASATGTAAVLGIVGLVLLFIGCAEVADDLAQSSRGSGGADWLDWDAAPGAGAFLLPLAFLGAGASSTLSLLAHYRAMRVRDLGEGGRVPKDRKQPTF